MACFLALIVAPGAVRAQVPGADPRFWSDTLKEDFLRSAEIVDRETLPTGVTLSSRVTLSEGAHSHDAHWQTIDYYHPRFKTRHRTYVDFRDSYRYNIAAYRLDRLLGLGMVPVSVKRSVGGKPGAMTWWIDDVMMTVRERSRRQVVPPDAALWSEQRYRGRAFNQLVYNSDAHLDNHLISTDWKLWLVDFTRAFRPYGELYDPDALRPIDCGLGDGLRRLTEETLATATASVLTKRERSSVLERRNLLLGLFAARVGAEDSVPAVCPQAER